MMNTPTMPAPRSALRIPLNVTPEGETEAVDLSHDETTDAYGHVLFLGAGGRMRIIADAHNTQWVAQSRRPAHHVGGPSVWRSNAFCTSKRGLKRALKALIAYGFPGLEVFINSLPEQHPQRGTAKGL